MTGAISPLAQALRMLQVQLAQARSAAAGGQPPPTRTTDAAATTPTALQALRGQLLAARGADGRLPAAKALRLFVQAALLDELGASLQLDPAFGELVERTCQALERDTAGAALLADALQELAALAGP
jgi:hypothetical protein